MEPSVFWTDSIQTNLVSKNEYQTWNYKMPVGWSSRPEFSPDGVYAFVLTF